MMQQRGICKRFTGAALVAVLVFNALVPIPILGQDVEELRYRRAQAFAPAVAAPVVFATALAAYGVYVAGTTSSSYNANLNALYAEFERGAASYSASWAQYCEDMGSYDAAMESAVTSDGGVNLGVLAGAGFFGALPAMVSGMASAGTAVAGATSVVASYRTVDFAGASYPVFDSVDMYVNNSTLTQHMNQAPQNGYPYLVIYFGETDTAAKNQYRAYVFATGTELNAYSYSESGASFSMLDGKGFFVVNFASSNYGQSWYANRTTKASTYGFNLGDTSKYLAPGVAITTTVSSLVSSNGAKAREGVLVSADPGVLAGTADVPTVTVKPFTPGTSKLETGYDSTDALQEMVAGQSEIISDLQSQITAKNAEIAQLNADVSGYQSQVGTLQQTVTAREAEVAQANTVIGELQQTVTAKEAELTQANAQVGTLEATVQAQEAEMQSVGDKVDALSAELDGVPGILEDILTGVSPLSGSLASILSAVNPIAAILTGVNALVTSVTSVANVVTGVQASPFDWLASWWDSLTGWWSTPLAWIGATPFATHVGNVIGNVAAVNDAIGGVMGWLGENTTFGQAVGQVVDAIGVVASGVGVLLGVNDATTWWGTLSGWWQGLLDWAGSTPVGVLVGDVVGALDGVLDGVVEGVGTVVGGVQAGVADIASAVQAAADALVGSVDGVLDGVSFWPSFDLGGPGDGFVVDGGKVDAVEASFADKAPWAYVVALSAVFEGLSGSYSSNASFYVDVPLDKAGLTRFDAGGLLLQEWNGVTIAYLIRVLVTSTICVSLLMVAYKGMERVTSSAD